MEGEPVFREYAASLYIKKLAMCLKRTPNSRKHPKIKDNSASKKINKNISLKIKIYSF